MDWYVADKDYVNYLCEFDQMVGYIEYGSRLKLHIGIILEVNEYKYYVPISSPKTKHKNMNNNLDFQKIQDLETGELYAVININNMIPIPENFIKKIKYNEIENYRTFEEEKDKDNYIYLLQKEKKIIDTIEENIQKKAQKLYNKCVKSPESMLAKRCCKFSLLEKKCTEYYEIYKKDKNCSE